ncbi:mucolipin-3-like [Mizuhopecten yessoensis]|uniref:mucolipin-3-like n=1 Tax=Mizuhopecten yessoensis TaxID=6573 RepID=UPI000B4598F2|nr:mucolipin-3-like [Mizuhopecten yessoensis]
MQTGNMGTEGTEMMDFTNTTSNPEGDELKQELRTYFSHTFSRCFQGERWWKKIPLKMIVHLISLTIITAQLVLFANERSHFATYLNRNNIALKHLLLRNWSKDYETMPYPPTTGTYAVYTIDELKEHVQFVVEGIHSLPTTAVGSFFLNNDNVTNPLRICATYYKSGIFNRTSQHSAITIDRNKRKQCKDVGINTTNYGLDPSLDDLIKSENGVLVS